MRSSNCLILFLVLLLVEYVSATDFNNPIGSRSAALGNASVTLTDFWSVHNNQAGLGSFENIAVGFYYENRYLVNELSLKSGAFVLPTKSGVFGLSYNHFGYSLYNESKVGLAYGRSFGNHFSAGVQLDYLHTKIAEDYGSKNTITFELGVLSNLTENFTIACHVFNPIGVKLDKDTDERIPVIIKLGASYSISDKLLIAIETEKDLEYKPLIRGGIEYQIIEQAIVRIGYSTLPSTSGSDSFSIASVYTFGFGLNLKKFVVDISSSVHQVLGWSPQVSMIYKFK